VIAKIAMYFNIFESCVNLGLGFFGLPIKPLLKLWCSFYSHAINIPIYGNACQADVLFNQKDRD